MNLASLSRSGTSQNLLKIKHLHVYGAFRSPAHATRRRVPISDPNPGQMRELDFERADRSSRMAVTKTSWQKGLSGNPRGRPRVGEELGALLRQTVDRQRFAEKLCELCYAGDVQAMRLLMSYTDGLPVGRPETSDTQGIQITVTYVQQNNRIELTSTSSGSSESDPRGEALQRSVLRAPLGQDGPRDGSTDSPGLER